MFRWIEIPANWLSKIGLVIAASVVVVMALMTGVGAISRYAIARPVPLVDELSAYMLVAIVFLGGGYLLQQRGHVKVDFIIKILPPRVAAWLTVATDVVSILGTVMLAVMTARVAAVSLSVGSRTVGLLEIPIGAVQLIIPIGLSAIVLQFLCVLSTSLKSALHQPEIQK